MKKRKELQEAIEEAEKQGSIPSTEEICERCGKPRVGHGSEGLACRVILGDDDECQYHG